MSEEGHRAIKRAIERIGRPDKQSQDPFDEKKFMDAEWQRLADFYGVTVEELQSPEFEAKQQAEEVRKRKLQEAEKNAFERRELKISLAVLAVTSLLLFEFARWYSIIAGVVAAYNCTSIRCDIRNKQVDRKELAWSTVVRVCIVVFAIVGAIAFAHKK